MTLMNKCYGEYSENCGLDCGVAFGLSYLKDAEIDEKIKDRLKTLYYEQCKSKYKEYIRNIYLGKDN